MRRAMKKFFLTQEDDSNGEHLAFEKQIIYE